ncbi:hypothetical protein ABIB57_000600 [Devosia sp. UYZn731]|uniref:hypothetical protein n=1 Tax=Devosia sp. UYZn731 TaxID=3156345 RepID=UPI00339925DC
MPRSLSCLCAIAALGVVTPSLAADYNDYPDLRPAYPDSWENSADNPLHFEAGVRYWYSIGQQKMAIGPNTQTVDTKTHSGEAFVRIDDDSTSTFVEATAGYGIAHEGTYSNNGGADFTMPAARLGYVGTDFGWLPFGDPKSGFGLGAVVGYQYTNDSPDTGRANFTTAKSAADISWSPTTGNWSVGGDSEINNFEIHEAKIGLAARADMGAFDLTGEATVTPYAWVHGTYGAAVTGPQGPFGGGPGGITELQASAAQINGYAYGVGGKMLVGFHPTDNLTLRVGGRASYLQGAYDATYDKVVVNGPAGAGPYTDPTLSRQRYIVNNNPFSMFRYGALVEISGRF